MRTKLRDNEEVKFVVEKHWVVLIKPYLIFLVSVLVVVFVLMSGKGMAFFWPLVCVALFLAINAWIAAKSRHVDLWVVTSERVIDESGLFTLNVKETPLDKINNVKYNQDINGRMLGYGDVDIMSAATDGDTLNRFVSHPKELYTAVITAQEEYKQVKANSPRTMGPDERTCPYCAEFIKKQAVFCKHCRHELLAADNSSNMKATAKNEGGYDMPPDNALNRGGNPIPPMPGPSAQVIPSQSMKSAEPEASSTPEIASAKDWLLGSNDTRDTASHMEARIAIKPE